MRRKPQNLSIALLFIAIVMASGAALGESLASLLKRPATPASLALLAQYYPEPKVVEKWKHALQEPDFAIRGVAARAVTTSGVTALLPDVEAALSKETEPAAAREEARALILLGHESLVKTALDASARFHGELDGDIVRSIARARGLSALPRYFSGLDKLHIGAGDRAAFFRIATRGQSSLLAAASMALGRLDLPAWKAILSDARNDPDLANSPVVRTALASQTPVFRSEAAWYLAKEYCDQPPSDRTELLSTLKKAEPSPASADPEIGFGEELLRRVLGEPPVENKEWIACLETNEDCHLDSDLGVNPLRRYLTDGERAALDDRNLRSVPLAVRPALLEKAVADAEKAKVGETTDPGMWLVSDLPTGLGVDFSRDLSCNAWGIAAIGYRPDGRPGKITVLVGEPVRPNCFDAYKAMFLLSLAPAGEPTTIEKPLTMEAVLSKEAFDCALKPPDDQGGDDDSVRVRGRVRAPLLLRRVEPFYPTDARAAHVQGISIVGAIISSSGCVRGIHLVKGSALSLDAAAMQAVSQWTYRPADLDGRNVAVYLTVTVNFRM